MDDDVRSMRVLAVLALLSAPLALPWSAFALVAPDLARRLPTAPENPDAGFRLEHREALDRRFDALVSRSR